MYRDLDITHSLKAAREMAGLTQKEVEAQLELRPLLVRDYEMGRLKLPIAMALRLAELYDVSLDELVGAQNKNSSLDFKKTLANFTSIFSGSSYQMMFLDPVMRAWFEDHRDDFFDKSMFEVLTIGLSDSEINKLVGDLGCLLFSLAGSDEKVSDHEIVTIRYILGHFGREKDFTSSKKFVAKEFKLSEQPKYFSNIHVRHFTIWLLFLFANTDGVVEPEELSFIERRAEELKVNRSNFLFIRNQFVKESV